MDFHYYFLVFVVVMIVFYIIPKFFGLHPGEIVDSRIVEEQDLIYIYLLVSTGYFKKLNLSERKIEFDVDLPTDNQDDKKYNKILGYSKDSVLIKTSDNKLVTICLETGKKETFSKRKLKTHNLDMNKYSIKKYVKLENVSGFELDKYDIEKKYDKMQSITYKGNTDYNKSLKRSNQSKQDSVSLNLYSRNLKPKLNAFFVSAGEKWRIPLSKIAHWGEVYYFEKKDRICFLSKLFVTTYGGRGGKIVIKEDKLRVSVIDKYSGNILKPIKRIM
ncbi:MAG: hypothetical protein ABFS35_06910 [Bacteroidota bacterium]